MANAVLFISVELIPLNPTLLYHRASDWTTLSMGGIKLGSVLATKFGVLIGKANPVSLHICDIRVLRPYPVILYRLRLDHSLLVEKNGIHWSDQICHT